MVLREGQDWSYVLKPEISSWKEDIIMPYPTFYKSTKKDYFSRSAHGTIVAKITYLFDLKK